MARKVPCTPRGSGPELHLKRVEHGRCIVEQYGIISEYLNDQMPNYWFGTALLPLHQPKVSLTHTVSGIGAFGIFIFDVQDEISNLRDFFDANT